MDKTLNLSALIMGAGLSSRLPGANKLLLDWQGKPILTHTISNVLAAGFQEVLLVLGNNEDEIKSVLKGYGNELKIIINPDYKKGLTSSIQQGVNAADDQTHGFIICLGDMFDIKGLDYAKLARYHLLKTPEEELITLPKVGDQIGNPVIFSQSFRSRIMGHDDPEGCKLIVKASMHSVQYFKSNILQFLQDIDTWNDYHRLSER
jgi:molybdenum cofactor cytidylyltransferase